MLIFQGVLRLPLLMSLLEATSFLRSLAESGSLKPEETGDRFAVLRCSLNDEKRAPWLFRVYTPEV